MIGLIAKAFASPLIKSVVDKVVLDKNARKDAREELERIVTQGATLEVQGQIEINKVEAGHKSLFVAGWRPFIGWVCGLGVFWMFLRHPFADTILEIAGSEILLPVIPEDRI